MNRRTILIIGILFGMLAVALGAFGAHALEELLESRGRTDTWDLAVQYQIIHALTLLFVGVMFKEHERWFRTAAVLLMSGVVCFSGSLYVLCLTDIVFPIVLITPLGGTLLIAGWLFMLIGVIRSSPKA